MPCAKIVLPNESNYFERLATLSLSELKIVIEKLGQRHFYKYYNSNRNHQLHSSILEQLQSVSGHFASDYAIL